MKAISKRRPKRTGKRPRRDKLKNSVRVPISWDADMLQWLKREAAREFKSLASFVRELARTERRRREG